MLKDAYVYIDIQLAIETNLAIYHVIYVTVLKTLLIEAWYTYTHAHTHTHPCTHARMCTHTHTHILVLYVCSCSIFDAFIPIDLGHTHMYI